MERLAVNTKRLLRCDLLWEIRYFSKGRHTRTHAHINIYKFCKRSVYANINTEMMMCESLVCMLKLITWHLFHYFALQQRFLYFFISFSTIQLLFNDKLSAFSIQHFNYFLYICCANKLADFGSLSAGVLLKAAILRLYSH